MGLRHDEGGAVLCFQWLAIELPDVKDVVVVSLRRSSIVGDVNPGDNSGKGVNGVWMIATPYEETRPDPRHSSLQGARDAAALLQKIGSDLTLIGSVADRFQIFMSHTDF